MVNFPSEQRPSGTFEGNGATQAKCFIRQIGKLMMLACLVVVGNAFAMAAESNSNVERSVEAKDLKKSEGAEKVTPEDLIRFATIGDPMSIDWRTRFATLATYSPDGTLVAIVVSSGDPVRGSNDARLLLYRTTDLLAEPRPTILAEFSSTSNYRPIAFVRWAEDSRSLLFSGANDDELPQIYRVAVTGGAVERVTNSPTPMSWFDVTPSGKRIVTTSQQPIRSLRENPDCTRRACRITSSNFAGVDMGWPEGSDSLTVYDLPSKRERTLPNPETIDSALTRCDPILPGGISPDGRFAIRHCRVRETVLPAWWGEYQAVPGLDACIEEANARCFRRAFLINIESGRTASWSDGPAIPYYSFPLWIDGGKKVILPGEFETLTNQSGAERAARIKALAVHLLDPVSLRVRRIGWLDPRSARVTTASWDEKSQILSVETVDSERKSLPTLHLYRVKNAWVPAATPSKGTNARQVELVIEQSINQRPQLVAIDHASEARRVLLDPNPWLIDRQLGQVEPITWRSRSGEQWSGGLIYPPDYQPGARYPLLLQTHGFRKEQFSLHGAYRAFAGQAIAANGILVLQVQESWRDTLGSERQFADVQAGYEGAIDHLADLGLIDRARIGIQGYSATGSATGYLMTHSEYPIAAAALTSTSDVGWLYYILSGASRNLDSQYGAAPFGAGLERWISQSPTFNMERVRTPLLLWGGYTPIGNWDWFAGLQRLGNPVESWYSADAVHEVYRAGQRLEINRLLVDWFRFWLKGEEDSETTKTDQYDRWRKLRVMHDQQSKNPRPPLFKWVAQPESPASPGR